MAPSPPQPSAWQTRRTRAVVRWYLDHYYGRPEDLGFVSTFSDPARVGAFAVSPAALQSQDPAALFRLLVATACFQRLRDALVQRILTSLTPAQATELTTAPQLRQRCDESPCPHLRDTASLRAGCDLTKEAGRGTCGQQPGLSCHLKDHTEWLRRYGHFGKMPTSLALALREAEADDLAALYRRVRSASTSRVDAAERLVEALSRGWRVSDKIAHMYLSMLTNPAYWDDGAPWEDGVAWEHFVVVDVNVDRFLTACGYDGPGTYAARAEFVRALAERVDLNALRPSLDTYNPRLVQQAMYVFMGASNRKLAAGDCSRLGLAACEACAVELRSVCPVRPAG